MAEVTFTILGCGSSGGVPRLGNIWGQCDPDNPKNRRSRCSVLVERTDGDGVTRVLIDTSPDMRQQLLDQGVGDLDSVVFTHGHADHMHGIDDLRMIVFNRKSRIPVWADAETEERLRHGFDYIFKQPAGSLYPPLLDMNRIDGDVTVTGAGGSLTFSPFAVRHGEIHSLGFRIGNVAYLPDVSSIPEDTWPKLEGLECWILDALRRDPHPSHAHLDLSLEWIERSGTQRAVLTNMHIDLDYETVLGETPDHVEPAYDGLKIRVAD